MYCAINTEKDCCDRYNNIVCSNNNNNMVDDKMDVIDR